MREITTQFELDMLTEVKKKEVVVVSGEGLQLNRIIDVYGRLKLNCCVRMSFSEENYVIARGNSLVAAWQNAHVVARDNALVEAHGNAHVLAWDKASVVAHDDSSAEARDNASVEAHDNAIVRCFSDGCKITLYGFAVCFAHAKNKIIKKSKYALVQKIKELDRLGEKS